MYISELNREQLIELKQSYLIQQNEETGEGTSYDELARADSIISDKVIQEVYSGINFTEEGMCGDMDFDEVRDTVSAITPVPGGIGTVTSAILLRHLVESAELSIKG